MFLAVAAFLINMVLARLITLQRAEIAALKAFGYRNREVGAALPRAGGGGHAARRRAGGRSAGGGSAASCSALYEGIFRFPDLRFRLTGALVFAALIVSGIAAVVGRAVRGAFRGQAAAGGGDAAARAGALPQGRCWSASAWARSPGRRGMMVVREIERHPLRTALSAVGIAGAIALVILGHFGIDSLDNYLEVLFRRQQRQDLAVTFAKPVSPRAVGELARLPGVITARACARCRCASAMGTGRASPCSWAWKAPPRFAAWSSEAGAWCRCPTTVSVITNVLGKILGVAVGGPHRAGAAGRRAAGVRPVVAGFLDESVGLQVYGSAGPGRGTVGRSGRRRRPSC